MIPDPGPACGPAHGPEPASTSDVIDVAVVIYPGFKSLEAVGPVHALNAANRCLAARGDPRRYRVELIAPMAGPVAADDVISLQAAASLAARRPRGTVMIVGALDIEAALAAQPEMIDWCRSRAEGAARFAAFCSGSLFLAAAGLLDGRRATTHWSVADLMRRRFPAVQVEADAIFLQEGQLWTSAGVTAAIDLTLAFVEQDFGRELALDVARDLVMYLKRPGGQSQFSALLVGRSGMADVQSWIQAHLHERLTTADIAAQAGMSLRNFTRRFAEEVGCSPADYLSAARCERAKTLLADPAAPLKAVAHHAGFSSDEQMRRAFVRRLSLTPRAYRERFLTTRGV